MGAAGKRECVESSAATTPGPTLIIHAYIVHKRRRYINNKSLPRYLLDRKGLVLTQFGVNSVSWNNRNVSIVFNLLYLLLF